jgi:hypothetical protein
MLLRTVAVLFGLFILAEMGARLAGLTDFPVYARSPGVGYSLAPSQHGAFLGKNHWFANAAGLVNRDEWRPGGCLLVGDSVVYGGNPVDYDNRVGALAEKQLHRPVWVAATGGWDMPNELAFLDAHPEQVRSADHIVFVFNKGDFGPAAPWTGNLSFPTHRPILATLYLVRRYVLPHPSELPPIKPSGGDASWEPAFDRFLATYPGPVSAILYPASDDMGEPAPHDLGRANLIDARPVWNKGLYRDAIHPNVAGNRVLAGLVVKACS